MEIQAPFAPIDHELIVGPTPSAPLAPVIPSAPKAPLNVTDDAKKAELEALVRVSLRTHSKHML